MNDNIKNLLQEYYQKNKIEPLPKYRHTRHDTHEDNSHTFYCQVTIFDPSVDSDNVEELYPVFEGRGTTKKEAEKAAAQEAYDYLDLGSLTSNTSPTNHQQHLTHSNPYQPPHLYSRIYLLDIENLPQCLNYKYPEDSLVLGFMSRHSHHFKNHYRTISKICVTEVIDSGSPDAADVYLAFRLGQLTHQDDQDREFVIVSGDHFIDPLQQCVRQTSTHHTVRIITSVHELDQELTN